jgi:hypothetical protein
LQHIIEKEKSNSIIDIDIEHTAVHLYKYYENLSKSAQNIEELTDKLRHLDSETNQLNNRLPTFAEEIHNTNLGSSLQKIHIDGMFINENVLVQDITTLKQQVEYENSSRKHHILDGTKIWKISNVREKTYDAESERQTSIYSPAFYTSETGYKLCIRLYLNGDGTARGTHMSIFLVVLRGEYDALLQWPFSYRVSFCLFDQRSIIESGETKQAKHIIESFRPDTKSISFQRPSLAMNIASGVPKFFPLDDFNQSSEINRYIIDDTMFIKVLIDFIGIPKSILPFVFSLNIALPIQIQQELIDEEIKRREEPNIT